MNDFQRDVLIGVLLVAAVFSFISGQFIMSTVLFATASIYTNIALSKFRTQKA